jgi:hypothetical protein
MKRTWWFAGLVCIGLVVPAPGEEAVPPAFEKSTKAVEETEAPDPFDPDESSTKLIQVQVESIELSHEALTKLLFLAKPPSADATGLRKQLQEMVSRNEATVLETQIVVARSGQKSTSESIHEFSYPTEFEAVAMEKKAAENVQETVTSSFPANPGMPCAFETRNLGSTLEIEPTLGEDDQIIDLRLVPELVWHTGNTVWQEVKDSLGNMTKFQMPDIYTMRINTAITCIRGQYTFVAAQSPKDANGNVDMTRKVMVFVKCDVLPVK